MKAYVFTSEQDHRVDTLVKDAQARGIELKVMTGDSSESVTMRANYDITSRPAALVTQNDGSYVRLWQGVLPSIAELDYAVHGRL